MIDKSHLQSWQTTVNLLAESLEVPAALIMSLQGDNIEVFAASQTSGNPYTVGDHDLFDNSGLYCETVIKTNSELLVPNALSDRNWNNNPDIKLGMIAYYGLPLKWPDGEAFGTICVLDKTEKTYSVLYKKLMTNFKDHIELDLALIKKQIETQTMNDQLKTALNEIKTLQSIIPICSYCHSVRSDEGAWSDLESYVSNNSDIQFSHGVCPECLPQVRKEAGLDAEET